MAERLVFDIDGTICDKPPGAPYEDSYPLVERIAEINELFIAGKIIIFATARGMGRTNNDPQAAEELFRDLTERQLRAWGVSYHRLFMGKPGGDRYIDDKGVRDVDFFHDR